jgi:hypothetical protein
VPLATLAFGPALPPPFLAGFDATAQSRYAARGLSAQPSTWHLDTCPPSLQADGWQRPEGWQPLRPQPHRGPGAPGSRPASVSTGSVRATSGAGHVRHVFQRTRSPQPAAA